MEENEKKMVGKWENGLQHAERIEGRNKEDFELILHKSVKIFNSSSACPCKCDDGGDNNNNNNNNNNINKRHYFLFWVSSRHITYLSFLVFF